MLGHNFPKRTGIELYGFQEVPKLTAYIVNLIFYAKPRIYGFRINFLFVGDIDTLIVVAKLLFYCCWHCLEIGGNFILSVIGVPYAVAKRRFDERKQVRIKLNETSAVVRILIIIYRTAMA